MRDPDLPRGQCRWSVDLTGWITSALRPYALLGALAHGVGFVMAVVLGVRGATNQADIDDSALDIQVRFLDVCILHAF